MDRISIKKTIVVIASDIDDTERRDNFREFMKNDLKAIVRTESVYEFDFSACKLKWKDIKEKIKEIIDNRTDTVFMWDMDKPKDEDKYKFYRTHIGK